MARAGAVMVPDRGERALDDVVRAHVHAPRHQHKREHHHQHTHARRTIRAVQRLRCKRLIMALELSIGLDAHAVGGAALLL